MVILAIRSSAVSGGLFIRPESASTCSRSGSDRTMSMSAATRWSSRADNSSTTAPTAGSSAWMKVATNRWAAAGSTELRPPGESASLLAGAPSPAPASVGVGSITRKDYA